MSNPNKRKGSQWETDVVEYLRRRFGLCERLTLNGAHDQGDAWFSWEGNYHVLECKAEKTIRLSEYLKELEVETANWAAKRPTLPAPHGAVVVKRRGKGIGDAYVVISLDAYVRLVKS